MPSWEVSSKKPFGKSKRELEKVGIAIFTSLVEDNCSKASVINVNIFPSQHQLELNLILKYSPFKMESQLFEQFDKIGSKGTFVDVNILFIWIW